MNHHNKLAVISLITLQCNLNLWLRVTTQLRMQFNHCWLLIIFNLPTFHLLKNSLKIDFLIHNHWVVSWKLCVSSLKLLFTWHFSSSNRHLLLYNQASDRSIDRRRWRRRQEQLIRHSCNDFSGNIRCKIFNPPANRKPTHFNWEKDCDLKRARERERRKEQQIVLYVSNSASWPNNQLPQADTLYLLFSSSLYSCWWC